ncbi:MAG: NAD(P)H-dependent oxidoreductase [Dietzia sp.]|uniref:NADPH-dependent FMN reductase n=1 Tax=unclassified Dietzia TaxID=2617939 RepID=UPI0015CB41D8|nr:NAD(P)H-dependent oxidoreductase [Dietzia sp.]MBB1033021.1 NAD(P)H-dependent oxidoreductase [Dietzia sp. CQ4]MBB1054700.1 NAD(P)H-dependent oxidoreductase [Dietzia sp. B44]MBC7297160.1 NAD(P)H-dependent oxidoreductase [Dietzia sp.]MDO8394477.1 NAD(P)H-dependent oxidoreductase [Dietzia sp.]
MKIGIILGSIRDERGGAAVADWVTAEAASRELATYDLVDLKSFDVPLLTSATVPGAANKQYDDERVTRWSEAIDSYDAFIFVTPEYNHGVPGALKNAFDSLGDEWADKPVAFVSYGAEGGVRAVEQWRQIVANFRMFGVRQQVSLSLFTEFGPEGLQPNDRRAGEISTLFDQLEDAVRRFAPIPAGSA